MGREKIRLKGEEKEDERKIRRRWTIFVATDVVVRREFTTLIQ